LPRIVASKSGCRWLVSSCAVVRDAARGQALRDGSCKNSISINHQGTPDWCRSGLGRGHGWNAPTWLLHCCQLHHNCEIAVAGWQRGLQQLQDPPLDPAWAPSAPTLSAAALQPSIPCQDCLSIRKFSGDLVITPPRTSKYSCT